MAFKPFRKHLLAATTFLLLVSTCTALNNGLALTPPMGWLSWTVFTCQTDCVKYPDACINEKLYTDMADRLVSDGYLEAGYNLVNIDDCWMAYDRDADGRLQANKTRFPNGMAFFLLSKVTELIH